jgi:hypothetical protein
MQLLNATFKQKSNVLCNKFMFPELTIGVMHETMERLYAAAEELKGLVGQSEVARHMVQSPQTLNNWEHRGMSKGGMLDAERLIGCSSVWLQTGRGSMFTAVDDDVSLSADDQQTLAVADYLPPDKLDDMIRRIEEEKDSKAALLAKLRQIRRAGEAIEAPPPPNPEQPEPPLMTTEEAIRGLERMNRRSTDPTRHKKRSA